MMSDTATTPPVTTIPLTRPVLGDEECAAVADVLRSGWLMQGPVVARFEQQIADYVGAAHAVAVSSGTAALHLSLLALGVGPGDEVIVPSFTFIAAANAVSCCSAKPVFADIDPRTYNLDPESVAQVVTDRTKVIIAVHQFGLPADLDGLRAVADNHGCTIIEDAACALGSTYKGVRIGSHSSLVCFSFHPRKVITTGEGGMITTGNAELAARLRRLRHHGMDLSNWERHVADTPRRESYVEMGLNYRMSDITAAVGTMQMRRLDGMIAARRRLACRYDAALTHHPHLCIAQCPYEAQANRQTYGVWLDDNAPIDRETVLTGLVERGVAAKHGVACIHREPCYRKAYGAVGPPDNRAGRLVHSERLSKRMLLLPLFPDMTNAEQVRVINAVYDIFGLAGPSAPSLVN